KELEAKFYAIKPGGDKNLLKDFTDFVVESLKNTPSATTEKTVQTWIKKQAWEETMTQMRRKWLLNWDAKTEYEPGAIVYVGEDAYKATKKNSNEQPPNDKSWTKVTLKPEDEPFREDMSRIAPDSNEQLTTFILTKGLLIGQAALSLIDPLI